MAENMPIKPTGQEEEYIARKEFDRKQKIKAEISKKLAKEEKLKLKELHHMRCPKCGMELVEIEYRAIMVDKCSGCEGIWLDAGELESVVKLGKTNLGNLFSAFKKD